MMKRIALIALVAAAPLAHANTFTTLTLPALNADIRTWTDGSAYDPLYPGAQTFNGVPFNLAVDGSGNTAFFNGTTDIAVNLAGITQAYTLINSAVGTYGANNGSVEFFGTNGAYYKVDLIQGVNIRDHFDGFYNNIIDGVNAVAAFNIGPGHARLDEQIYNLPGVFATETLQTIRFTSPGVDGGSGGIGFITAATVGVVPEPGTYALMFAGLGIVALMARRRNG